jgi:hypothetical protein
MAKKGEPKTGGRTAGAPKSKTKVVKKREPKDIHQATKGEKRTPFFYPKIVENKKTGKAGITIELGGTFFLGTYDNDLWNNIIHQIGNVCLSLEALEGDKRSFTPVNATSWCQS